MGGEQGGFFGNNEEFSILTAPRFKVRTVKVRALKRASTRFLCIPPGQGSVQLDEETAGSESPHKAPGFPRGGHEMSRLITAQEAFVTPTGTHPAGHLALQPARDESRMAPTARLSRTRTALLTSTLLVIPLLSGCMPYGMGMGGMHEGPANHEHKGTKVVQPLRRDGIALTLKIPALRVGQTSDIVATVVETANGRPVRGAHVSFTIAHLESTTDPGDAAHDSPPPSDADSASRDAALVLQAQEGDASVYRVSHRFEVEGLHEVTVQAQLAANEGGGQSTTAVARPEVAGTGGSALRTGHMVGLGGLGMLAMMAWMWLW